jgi:hypothetical protein
MIIRRIIVSVFIVLSFVLIGCSASTGTRYANEKDKTTNKTDKNEVIEKKDPLKEDFDITKYKTKIILPEKPVKSLSGNDEIWFTYENNSAEIKKKSIIGVGDGYRVLVLVTDNLDEANQLRSEIYFSNKTEEVYVDFEPPFYKVKIGDFESERNATDLRFKLNQQGYQEAKVIKDKINKFE